MLNEEESDSEQDIEERTFRPLFKIANTKNLSRIDGQQIQNRDLHLKKLPPKSETNPEYIIDTIDKDCFYEYVDYIGKYKIAFEPCRRISQLDNILKYNINTFQDIDVFFGLKDTYKTEYDSIQYKLNQIIECLKMFQKMMIVKKKSFR